MSQITKEKFQSYRFVQESGETNMFDIKRVIVISAESAQSFEEILTKEECLEIMKNYDKYLELYEPKN